MDIDQQIRTLEERKNYLEGELATIKPNTPIMSVTGERILDSAERLRALRAQYAGASANLAPDHPDIMKMKQEIEALEKETGQLPKIEEASKQLYRRPCHAVPPPLKRCRVSDHPDVVQASSQRLKPWNRKFDSSDLSLFESPCVRPENPAYINLQAQLNSATSSLNALRATRTAVKRRLQDYAARLERTPEMEPDYLFLTRDRDTSGQKYPGHPVQAAGSQGLGRFRGSAKKANGFLSSIRPACRRSRTSPTGPPLCFWDLFWPSPAESAPAPPSESLDHSIRTPEQLARLTQLSPLAVIPFMPNEQDLSSAVSAARLLKGAGVGALVTILALLHVFVVPLDVLWFAALRRFGIE